MRDPSAPLVSWVVCLVLAVVFGRASKAAAARLATRAEVLSVLGAAARLEDFERFPADTATYYGFPSVLDSTTVRTQGQGPGLVRPGLTFRTEVSNLVWQGRNTAASFGSRVLAAAGGYPPSTALNIDLAPAARAVGVDVNPWQPQLVDVEVFGTDDTTLLDTVHLDATSGTAFFGYFDARGIGRVRIVQSAGEEGMNPLAIDNLVVPEPGGAALLITLAAAWLLPGRRRRGPAATSAL